MSKSENTRISSEISEVEFRGLSRIEKAVKLIKDEKATYQATCEYFQISKGSLQRAVKATSEGRSIGRNGKPPTFTVIEELCLVDLIKEKIYSGENIKLDKLCDIVKIVRVKFFHLTFSLGQKVLD